MHYKEETEYQNPLCIEHVHEDEPGGGIVDSSELESKELLAGSVVGKDANGLYHLIKTALLHANVTASATGYPVKKKHEFKIGDFITCKGVANCKAYAITGINRENEDYDMITVGTSLGVAMNAANGLVLEQAKAEDTSGGTSEPPHAPLGLTTGTTDISNGNGDIAVMVRGTVKESLLPYPLSASLKNALSARIYFR